jgi:hypothetical protein
MVYYCPFPSLNAKYVDQDIEKKRKKKWSRKRMGRKRRKREFRTR